VSSKTQNQILLAGVESGFSIRPNKFADVSVKSCDLVSSSESFTVTSAESPDFWYAATPLGGDAITI